MFGVQQILAVLLDHAAHVAKSIDHGIRTDFGPWAQGARSRCQADAPLLGLLASDSAIPHEELVGPLSQNDGTGHARIVPTARSTQVQERLIAGFCPGPQRMHGRGHADPVSTATPMLQIYRSAVIEEIVSFVVF